MTLAAETGHYTNEVQKRDRQSSMESDAQSVDETMSNVSCESWSVADCSVRSLPGVCGR